MYDVDDKIRSEVGVVVCLRRTADGRSKLILDDVSANSTENPIEWSFDRFFTWKEYPDEPLDAMALTEKEYQGLGEYVVARLLALNGRTSADAT